MTSVIAPVVPVEKTMDAKQWEATTKVFAKEKTQLKEQAEREAMEKQRYAEQLEAMKRQLEERDSSFKQMQAQLEHLRSQKKQEYGKIIKSDVEPFLNTLKDYNKDECDTFENCGAILKRDLDKHAFTEGDSLCMFKLVQAAASQRRDMEKTQAFKLKCISGFIYVKYF